MKEVLAFLIFLLELLYPTPVVTPAPSPIPSPSPTVKELAVITRIVDGDTVELSDGRKLRYTGIDTPETKDPRRGVQCYGPEASKHNSELVLNKSVELEKDVSEVDRYGRLLRYVYLDGTLINESLVKDGYAHASSYPPDIKYQEKFKQAEAQARAETKGLWGTACNPASPSPTPTATTSASPTTR